MYAETYSEQLKRKAIVKTLNSLTDDGLSPVRSGNISIRCGDGMLITPTGMTASETRADDIVYCNLDGSTPTHSLKPSSEWQFHAGLYRARPEMNAVVHCHSRFATILASAHLNIPAFHYMVATAGGKEIPLADYALFGSIELTENIIAVLKEANACLISNHGQLALGQTLQQAYELAIEVEELACQYYHVKQMDRVHLLDDEQMEEVLAKFSTYGQNAQYNC